MEFVHSEECFVAFLDILGFSEAVMSKSPEYILSVFETIKTCKKEIQCDKCPWESEYDELSNNTIVYIMSDSVVLAIKSTIDGSLDYLIKWCKEIQFRLLINHKLLIRGGISHGLHYQDQEIAFGTGFVKAHIIESVAKTPRIVIDDALNVECGTDVLEDEDKKKYIDFLCDCYWDDNMTDFWMSFAKENINKHESLVEKYQWLSNQFARCNERFLMREEQEAYSLKYGLSVNEQ